MASSVPVAVIPCAGAGTRLRPATRVVPKALIPVVDRPVIQYVVAEARDAGVKEIVLVVDDRPGDPVMAHFTNGEPVEGFEDLVFTRVIQDEPRGLGDAVLTARDAVGDRAFLCLLADMFPRPGHAFGARMTEVFDGSPVMAIRQVGAELLDRYGIVSIGDTLADDLVRVTGAVEKPGPKAPSDLGLVGRYVLTPAVFDDLAATEPGHGGEIQLTDAIDRGARRDGALGLIVGDDLLDMGQPAGLLVANAEVGLSRSDLAPRFRETLETILSG